MNFNLLNVYCGTILWVLTCNYSNIILSSSNLKQYLIKCQLNNQQVPIQLHGVISD